MFRMFEARRHAVASACGSIRFKESNRKVRVCVCILSYTINKNKRTNVKCAPPPSQISSHLVPSKMKWKNIFYNL